MTVLEPTPERTSRGQWLRRATFTASSLALTSAFAFSLSGIASTQGSVKPGGPAAALAAKQATRSDAAGHRDCHRGGRGRGAAPRV
jgi:hypothetical protein